MRTSYTALSLLAVATSTLAQTAGFDVITSPEAGAPYKVGDSIPILWTPGTTTGTVTITLIGGTSSAALGPVKLVVAGISSQTGAYSYKIPADVGAWASYGFNLTLDADPNTTFQYSNAFYITGGGSASSVSSSTSASVTPVSTPVSSSVSSSKSTPIATSVEQTSTSCTGVTTSATSTWYAYETKPAAVNSTIVSVPTSTLAASTSKATVAPVTNGTATGSSIPVATASGAGKLVTGSLAMIGGLVFALFL